MVFHGHRSSENLEGLSRCTHDQQGSLQGQFELRGNAEWITIIISFIICKRSPFPHTLTECHTNLTCTKLNLTFSTVASRAEQTALCKWVTWCCILQDMLRIHKGSWVASFKDKLASSKAGMGGSCVVGLEEEKFPFNLKHCIQFPSLLAWIILPLSVPVFTF